MGTLALPVPGCEPRDFTSLHPPYFVIREVGMVAVPGSGVLRGARDVPKASAGSSRHSCLSHSGLGVTSGSTSIALFVNDRDWDVGNGRGSRP